MIRPIALKFQCVPAIEANKMLAVERIHHQLLPELSDAYRFVAKTSSLPCFVRP